MKPLEVLIVYNEPALAVDHPDYASEAGVLDSVERVSATLAARGHRVRPWGIGQSLRDFAVELAGQNGSDVAFNLFEGFGGVGRGEAEVAGMVELAGYPITGSPPECLALVRDKARTKWLLAGAGIRTAAFELFAADEPIDDMRLERLMVQAPLIVKPAHEDASLGIGPQSVVDNHADLLEQVASVRQRYGAVLVEQFIAGREFNAAVLALPTPQLLPVAEIEFCQKLSPAARIVTYDAKWAAGSADDLATPVRCPARLDQATHDRIEDVALAAFRHAGCRDFARVDLRMDDRGDLYVLEVNGNPDIGPSGGFDRALQAAGVAYDDFIERLVRAAHQRRSPIAGKIAAGH